MKKEYQEPIIELIDLEDEDIIMTSGIMNEMPGDMEWKLQ